MGIMKMIFDHASNEEKHLTQRDIVRQRFLNQKTVKCYEFALKDGILQYNRLIKELRDLEGLSIPAPIIKFVNGQKQSTYRLIR